MPSSREGEEELEGVAVAQHGVRLKARCAVR